VNTVMNLWVPKVLASSWVAAQLAASQEGLSSMSEWVRKDKSICWVNAIIKWLITWDNFSEFRVCFYLTTKRLFT
jgi:hypothetical protein